MTPKLDRSDKWYPISPPDTLSTILRSVRSGRYLRRSHICPTFGVTRLIIQTALGGLISVPPIHARGSESRVAKPSFDAPGQFRHGSRGQSSRPRTFGADRSRTGITHLRVSSPALVQLSYGPAFEGGLISFRLRAIGTSAGGRYEVDSETFRFTRHTALPAYRSANGG